MLSREHKLEVTKVMTEQDAIKIFDGLRKGYRRTKQGDDLRALHALLTGGVLPSSLGAPCSSALTTLPSVFAEIDKWKRRTAAIALSERQRQISELRSAGLTYRAIGDRLGISGQRVRQIHMRLLTRIRCSLLNE
jgi:DNA-binding CsgD family transcriptional regulator